MRPGRWSSVALRLLTALLLFAACAPAASPAPSGWIATWEPRNAWERALDAIDPATGNFDKDAALRLFATAFGPLPGVDVQQDLTGITDRTIAISAVMAHRDELTHEQRAAIDAAIAPPAGSEQFIVSDSSAAVLTASTDAGIAGTALALARSGSGPASGSVHAAAGAFPPGLKEAIEESVDTYRTIIASKLGVSLSGRIIINLAPQPTNEPNVLGQAWSKWPGGVFGDCEITLFPLATELGGVETLDTLAHEVFHCFQFDQYHSLLSYATAPRWVVEGQATWAGETLAGGDTGVPFNHWRRYLTMPWLSLTGRTYDAIGFYSHLAESGTDPWTRFRAMIAAGSDSAAAFVNADAEGPIFLDSWGSSIVRERARGFEWDTIGPSITEDSYLLRPPTIIGDGDIVRISTPAFTADAYAYEASTDMIRISIPGSARLSDGRLNTPLLDGVTYCVEGNECEPVACPGDAGPPKEYPTIGTRFTVGISGGTKPTAGTIRGIKAGSPDECEEDPPDEPPPPGGYDPGGPSGPGIPPADREPCQSKCGESNGDVHVRTLGGGGYSFQGVGEFVFARSADGAFEVQTRQAPLQQARAVSINTAVAVRVGAHRMALYLPDGFSAPRLTIDGVDTPVTGPVAFGNGLVIPYSGGFRIDTGDGSHVYAIGASYRGFNLIVEPGPAREAGLAGLMGSIPIGADYPSLPDGSVLLRAPDRHTAYEQLYVTLADAWRVTPGTSLFDYAAGTSTETFTQRDYPGEADLVQVGDLTAAQLAAGEAACAGVLDPDLHTMCVYDVGVTADSGYGDLYEAHITLLETGSLGQSGERVRVVNLYANEGVGTAVDVYAWVGDALDSGTRPGTGPVLVATVPYGAASEWFNPGKMSNGPFAPVNWISIQRDGEPLRGWQFNLFDQARDSLDGLSRVLVIAGDPDGFAIGGGSAISSNDIREAAPEGYFPLIDPPPGKALGFLNPFGMFYIDQATSWAASVGGRCLTDPEFPTLAMTAQGTSPRPVQLEPGTFEVAVHEFPPGADPFDLNCGRFPAVARASVSVDAGDRVHLFVFAENETAPIQLLPLRVGD